MVGVRSVSVWMWLCAALPCFCVSVFLSSETSAFFDLFQTRAVQAETLVAKLKQDVKALQGQVQALASENEALVSGDRGLADIRERTKYASEQLASAAVTAENNLR